jgi:hypothetical protein
VPGFTIGGLTGALDGVHVAAPPMHDRRDQRPRRLQNSLVLPTCRKPLSSTSSCPLPASWACNQ